MRSTVKKLLLLLPLSLLFIMTSNPYGHAAADKFCSLGDRPAKGYCVEGMRYRTHENFAEAAHYFGLASSQEPNNTTYLSLLAWSYFKLAQYDKASAVFEQIEKLDPSLLDAYTGPGWIHFKTAEFDPAIQNFEEALEVHPESSEVFAGLGWCYFRKNDIPVAKKYLNIALHKGLKNPNGTEPEAQRALGYLYFSQNNFKEALKHFKIAVRHSPNWNDARVKWGDCLFSMGKYSDSITVYNYALRREKTAEIYDKLGWAFLYAQPGKFSSPKKNLERARVMFRQALVLNPGYKSSQSGLEAVQKKMSGAAH